MTATARGREGGDRSFPEAGVEPSDPARQESLDVLAREAEDQEQHDQDRSEQKPRPRR